MYTISSSRRTDRVDRFARGRVQFAHVGQACSRTLTRIRQVAEFIRRMPSGSCLPTRSTTRPLTMAVRMVRRGRCSPATGQVLQLAGAGESASAPAARHALD